jgi:hypothetical protein
MADRHLTFCIAALAVLSAATSAVAESARLRTESLGCAAVAGVVTTRGAAVLSTSATTYERFVRDRSFCLASQITVPEFVRSADNPQCLLYRCSWRDRRFRSR